LREEALDHAVLNALKDVDLSDEELLLVRSVLDGKKTELQRDQAAMVQALRLQLDNVESRLASLTDLLIDGTVDKALFTEKKNTLLMERTKVQEKLSETQQGMSRSLESFEKTVELAKGPSMLYEMASSEKKRELLKTLLSNLAVSGKNVSVTLALPFRLIAERENNTDGGPRENRTPASAMRMRRNTTLLWARQVAYATVIYLS
jgi:site-specific DNA recombinase